MQAIVVEETGGPEVLKLKEVPLPSPAPHEALVRCCAIGINPVDTYIRAGQPNFFQKLPYTPGHDAAGIVESVGERVKKFKKGDRVYLTGSITGTYAEYALCKEEHLHPLPAHLSFEQGAGIHVPYVTAYRALFQRACAMAGETVLIHGATGGVGIAAVQLAVAAGMKVLGTGGSAQGRQLVLEQGAIEVFDHTSPDYLDKIMAHTGGNGVDVILEMAAHINLGKDCSLIAPKGRIAVIGSRGSVQVDPRNLLGTEASVLGVSISRMSPKEAAAAYAALGAGLANYTLKPIVGKKFSLEDAPKAHLAVYDSGTLGKIVLVP